jgi:tetratricopeptide (TPR) repeat protein
VSQGAFEESIALLEEAEEILPEDRRTGLFEFAYDRWAKSFMKDKKWPKAIGIYDQGLRHAPTSGLLKQNREYCARQRG